MHDSFQIGLLLYPQSEGFFVVVSVILSFLKNPLLFPLFTTNMVLNSQKENESRDIFIYDDIRSLLLSVQHDISVPREQGVQVSVA